MGEQERGSEYARKADNVAGKANQSQGRTKEDLEYRVGS